MRLKYLPSLLLTCTISSAAWAQGPSSVDELKAMLDQISNDEINEQLLEAYLQNRSFPVGNGWSIWSGYRNSNLNDSRSVNAKEADGDTYSLGLDYRLSPRLLLGGVFNMQDTKVVSDPSPAPLVGYSSVDSDGDGYSLYGTYILNNGIGVDAGFSFSNTDSVTTDFSALADPTEKSTSGSNNTFGIGASLVYPFSGSSWVNGRIGYTHAWGNQDEYLDIFDRVHDKQDYEAGTISVNTVLNYSVNEYLRPYAGINLGYDLISSVASPAPVLNPPPFGAATQVPYQDERKSLSYGFQAGIAINFNQAVSLNGSYQQTNWGSDLDVSSFSVTLRLSF